MFFYSAQKVVWLTLIAMSLSSGCWGDSPHKFQMQAAVLREEGNTLEALHLYNCAIVGYQKEHNYKGVLESLCGRLIAWQHLFNQEEDMVYAILARQEAEAMLRIAQRYAIQDKNYLIHFLFGKSAIFLKDFAEAEKEFRAAIELYPDANAEKGDWLAHLGEAIFRNGSKEEGILTILQGIEYIESHASGIDSFRINVWISGAYLRLAKILIIDGNLEEARIYLQKGEEIVLRDPRLVIRMQQLENLREKILTL